jgi:hypothetical protein
VRSPSSRVNDQAELSLSLMILMHQRRRRREGPFARTDANTGVGQDLTGLAGRFNSACASVLADGHRGRKFDL